MTTDNRPTPEQVEAIKKLNTTIISDTFDELGINGVLLDLKPVLSGVTLVGPAVTVTERRILPGEQKLRLGEAMDAASSGDVLVIDAGGDPYAGTWGGLVTLRAQNKRLAGVIVDGASRDTTEIREYGFPVWSKYITPISAVKRLTTTAINATVQLGEVTINPGDLIIADDDGVCAIPFERLDEVIQKATTADEWEKNVLRDLKEGLKSQYFTERIV